jgi:hypothetical protein
MIKIMKKIIFYLIAIVFVAFTSCEEQDNIDRYDLGTEFLASNGGITSLDDNVTVNINNISKNLSEVSVVLMGDSEKDLGKISLSDGTGAATYTNVELGLSGIGSAASLKFSSTIDGKSIIRYGSVEVESPFTLTPPDGLEHRDTTYYFIYEVAPVSAAVTSIDVSTKVGSGGTYAPATPVNGDLKKDSIPLKGLDYNVDDTIFIMVIAKTATKTDTANAEVIVAPDSYDKVVKFTMDDLYNIETSDSLAFDLIGERAIAKSVAGDTADLVMSVKKGAGDAILDFEFVSENNLELVETTKDFYNNADKKDISDTDFSSAGQRFDAVAGKYYVYRTKRGSGDYVYGVLRVVEVNEQVDISACTLTLEYKH